MRTYNKLVRDLIPDIISRSGERPITRTLSPDEFAHAVRAKLLEELGEFQAGPSYDEAADLLEVVYSLIASAGLEIGEVDRYRRAKTADRGGFTKRVFLESVESIESGTGKSTRVG